MFETTATHVNITDLHILLVRHEGGGRKITVGSEPRPATLADADTALAFYSLGRITEWDLAPGVGVFAQVKEIDNRFNGTVAARLEQAVGTTHEEFEYDQASNVENGDLISDSELSGISVVAGCSTDGDVTKIHQVTEGRTWDDRYTGHFMPGQFIMRARRKA